jgi:O-antigen/teichoic acid export membrane protein
MSEERAGAPAPSEADLATRGSGIRLAAEVGGRLLSVATTFLLAAALGVERFGLFAAASGIAVIAAELAELGLQATAARALVARTLSLPALLRAKLAVSVGVAAAGVALPAAAARLVPALAGPALALQPALVLFYVVAGWSELCGVALRARGRRLHEALVLLVLRASTLAAVALALRAGTGLAALAWAHAASTLPPLAFAFLLLGRAREPAGEPRSTVAGVLRASLPLFVNGVLTMVSLRVELLALYFLRGPREAGLFGAALKILESLGALPSAVTAGAMPSLTREGLRASAGGGAPADVRRRLAATVALLAVPAGLGLALEAPRVLALLGPGYAAGAPALRVLGLAVVATFTNVVAVWSLIAVGRASRLPGIMAVRVVLGALGAVVLVPAAGATGAAAGLAMAEVALLCMTAYACAAAGFAVPVALPLLRALALSVPMAAAVSFAPLGLPASIALGAAVYAATLLIAWRAGLGAPAT